MSTNLDLRQNLILDIFANKNVKYFPSFDNINQLDVNYSIIMSPNTPEEIIYIIGNGLTLVSTSKSIIWELDTTLYDIGIHEGYLASESNIAGIYLYIKIRLHIE